MTLPTQPEEQAVSAAPEVDPVVAFLAKHNISVSKQNVREWGGFEVAFTIDHQTHWMVPNQPRGWGFSAEEAAAHVLKEIVNNPDFDNNLLKDFLTQEQLDELTTIV